MQTWAVFEPFQAFYRTFDRVTSISRLTNLDDSNAKFFIFHLVS
jgi:hypothetical protein